MLGSTKADIRLGIKLIRFWRKTILEAQFLLCYPITVKMTFAIPDDVGQHFQKAVPARERSGVVTNLLRKKLRLSRQSLEAVCRRVNRLETLDKEMTEWERFDDQEA